MLPKGRRTSRFSEIGSQVAEILCNILVAVMFVVEIIIGISMISRTTAGVNLFPWGEGIGEDLMELLVRWVIMVIIGALLYIFDSMGPCVFGKVTYFFIFAPAFLYPFIGGPGFFSEKFSESLYIKLFCGMIYISYILMAVDLIRWVVYLVNYYKKRKDAIKKEEKRLRTEGKSE